MRRVFILRKRTLKITDERVKLSNEILQGIKAVKFYAWEKPFRVRDCLVVCAPIYCFFGEGLTQHTRGPVFHTLVFHQGKVGDIRNREVAILQSTIVFRALFVVVISALPTLISVVTFAFYTGVFKNELDVSSVFTAILLLSGLRGPLLSLPFAVTAVVEAKVRCIRKKHAICS